MSEEITTIRASTRKHNGSYRRKLRQLYAQNIVAAQILENQVQNGSLTEHEFEVTNVESVKRDDNNSPYLYNISWEKTTNGPDAFIGCENTLKKFIPKFFKKTLEEIRNELVKQYMFNESLEDEQEYEKIVIPKIRKN